ncbi:MAG: DUF1016 N-terminal domain-containing protein [Saccharofermentanales bacterium]|jgi:hypothetical protein
MTNNNSSKMESDSGKGGIRAEYGTELLKTFAKEMEKSYGKGLNQRNLYYYVRFYDYFPQIMNAVSSKSPTTTGKRERKLVI